MSYKAPLDAKRKKSQTYQATGNTQTQGQSKNGKFGTESFGGNLMSFNMGGSGANSKLPSEELLARLSRGSKPKISKKEMKKRTQKNYNKLFEVKAKEKK